MEKNMKKFIVKDTLVNTKTGEEKIYYMGKDGYVHDDSTFFYCDGWKRERFAREYIKKDMNFHLRYSNGKIINDYECFEYDWKHIYEILVISGNAD